MRQGEEFVGFSFRRLYIIIIIIIIHLFIYVFEQRRFVYFVLTSQISCIVYLNSSIGQAYLTYKQSHNKYAEASLIPTTLTTLIL